MSDAERTDLDEFAKFSRTLCGLSEHKRYSQLTILNKKNRIYTRQCFG